MVKSLEMEKGCCVGTRWPDVLLLSFRPGVPLTVQAFSEEERKQWLEALGGKEAVRISELYFNSRTWFISKLFLFYSIWEQFFAGTGNMQHSNRLSWGSGNMPTTRTAFIFGSDLTWLCHSEWLCFDEVSKTLNFYFTWQFFLGHRYIKCLQYISLEMGQ